MFAAIFLYELPEVLLVSLAYIIYFFVDEFFTASIVHDDNALQIENVDKLLPQYVHKATSVMSQWQNRTRLSCDVEVVSASLNQGFVLDPQQSFGFLLPKGEEVKFTFCNETGTIDLTKL